MKQILTFGALALALLASTASAQTQQGAIKGTVTDQTTGVPLLLVTVVATSPALQGQQSEFTDASGQYFLSSLPPGTYSLLFIYGDAKIKRENVEVGVGKEAVVNAKINTQATGEVITIIEKAPTIDSGSTKSGTTVQQDYIKHVPNKGRTWSAVLGAAAGSQGDALGTGFSGSTSIENNYVVDGVNTTGVSLGAGYPTQGSQVINNFIQEIEVITGGYNAEFGRSTGGVVNVVTKTGSNEFHGSVFGNYVAFNAATEQIVTAGSAIQYVVDQPKTLDFGFEIGGPIIKDKLWFYAGFAPLIQNTDVIRKANTRVDRNRRFFDYADSSCAGSGGQKNTDGTCNADFATDPQGLTTSKPGCELVAGIGTGGNACEGDGIQDLDPRNNATLFEEVDRTKQTDKIATYQFTGKLNFAVTPEHQGQLGLTGQYNDSHDVPGGASLAATIFGTPTRSQRDSKSLNTDFAAKWTSKFFDNKTQVDAIYGYHRNKIDDSPITDTPPNDPTHRVTELSRSVYRVPYAGAINHGTLGNLGRNDDVPESDQVLQFCTDGDPSVTDPWPTIVNCPITSYGLYSIGAYRDNLEQRHSGKLTVTQRVKAAGHHQFKAGLDFESNILDDQRAPTGGRIDDLFNWDTAQAAWDVFRYVKLGTGNDVCRFEADGSPLMCDYLGYGDLNVHTNTVNYGAFIQDSWSILPNLTVNAGLRYEQQYMRYAEFLRGTTDTFTGEKLGTNALALKDLIAPRFGFIYDWTKEGRSKVYASWGRYYESIPMDINNRAFGGEVTTDTFWDYDTQCGDAPTGSSDKTTLRVASLSRNCPNSITASTDPDGADLGTGTIPLEQDLTGGATLVVPGVKPQYLDELTAGVEYEVLSDLRVGLSYQNRRAGRVLEDMYDPYNGVYFIGNPSEVSDDGLKKIEDRIAMETDPDRRAELITRLDRYERSRIYVDSPKRDYNALSLTAAKRFSRAFMVQGSYTYSVLRGNYPGLFSPDRVQVDPNITSQFDLVEYQANRFGKLPFDRPHNFKLDGYYTFDLEQVGRVTAGLRFRAQSGIPLTALGGSHPVYGFNEAFELPRGALGRTPFQTQTDFHVAYGRKLGKMDIEVYFELFNMFNQQYETQADRNYITTYSDPIVGGDKADLDHLKGSPSCSASLQGCPTGFGSIDATTRFATTGTRNVNFLAASNRNPPLSGRFGVTLSF